MNVFESAKILTKVQTFRDCALHQWNVRYELRHDSWYWIYNLKVAFCTRVRTSNEVKNQHWGRAAGMSQVERWGAFLSSSSICSRPPQSFDSEHASRAASMNADFSLHLKFSHARAKSNFQYLKSGATHTNIPLMKGTVPKRLDIC